MLETSLAVSGHLAPLPAVPDLADAALDSRTGLCILRDWPLRGTWLPETPAVLVWGKLYAPHKLWQEPDVGVRWLLSLTFTERRSYYRHRLALMLSEYGPGGDLYNPDIAQALLIEQTLWHGLDLLLLKQRVLPHLTVYGPSARDQHWYWHGHRNWRGDRPFVGYLGWPEVPVHRLLWTHYRDPADRIKDGKRPRKIAKLCPDNAEHRWCVNPWHFEIPQTTAPGYPAGHKRAKRGQATGLSSHSVRWDENDIEYVQGVGNVVRCRQCKSWLGARVQAALKAGAVEGQGYCPGCYQNRKLLLPRHLTQPVRHRQVETPPSFEEEVFFKELVSGMPELEQGPDGEYIFPAALPEPEDKQD